MGLDTRTDDTSPLVGDPDGPGLDFAALRESGRGPDGRWQKGAMPRLKHGLRVAPEHPAMGPLLAARESEILADLGQDVSTVEAALVRELARVSLLVEAAGEALIARGLLTSTGSARAMVSVYQGLVDRQIKLSSMVGLSRRQKPAMDLHDYAANYRGGAK